LENATERPTVMLKCTIKVFEDGEEIGQTKFKRNKIFNEANDSLASDINRSNGGVSPCYPLLGSKSKRALGDISAEEKARISKLIDDGEFGYSYVDSDDHDISSCTKILIDNFIELSVITFHVWIDGKTRSKNSSDIPARQRKRNTMKIQAYVRRFSTAHHVSKCVSNSGTNAEMIANVEVVDNNDTVEGAVNNKDADDDADEDADEDSDEDAADDADDDTNEFTVEDPTYEDTFANDDTDEVTAEDPTYEYAVAYDVADDVPYDAPSKFQATSLKISRKTITTTC
jgi:hypothetical protein